MDNKLNKKYQYGWYGTCNEDCESKYFDTIQDREYIESIVRVSLADGRSFEKFTAYAPETLSWVSKLPEGETFDDYINPEFKHLECGMGYLVIRNSDNLDKVPVVDGFTVAHFENPSGGFVAVAGCPAPTPTPTPKEPYINIVSAIPDYSYDGDVGEVRVTLKVTLAHSVEWQYRISNDTTWWVIDADSNGNPQTTRTFVIGPGDYTITAHGLDADRKLGKGPNSSDTFPLKVNAPTPTPTPAPLPTPTPTQTPTPTPTPVSCECAPPSHIVVEIPSLDHQAGGHAFLTFAIGSEVGINMDEFKTGLNSSVTLLDPDNTHLGMINFGGKVPDISKNPSFYLKDPGTRLCYVGHATNANKVSQTSWTIVMQLAVLPEDCQPTPTPLPENCCHGLSESTTVNDKIESNNYVSGETVNVTGTLCWDTFDTNVVGGSFACPFEVDDWSKGGLQITVQGQMDSTNNLFRFTTTEGVCYEARLTDSGEGVNIFNKVD